MHAPWLSRRPAPPLDLFIDTLWTSQRAGPLPHGREWGLPNGCADLVVPLTQDHVHRYDGVADRCGRHLAEGVLQGVQQGPTLRDTAGALCVVGVHFRPGGLAAFFDAPADRFTDQTIALADLWPGFGPALRERLTGPRGLAAPETRLQALETALRARLRRTAAPSTLQDPLVQWAIGRLAGGEQRIGDVQRASGCSPARFIARDRAACGVAPKRHAELMRFHTLLSRAPRAGAWALAAADAGYADQAHLAREFRRFAGFSPTDYLRNATGFATHVACP